MTMTYDSWLKQATARLTTAGIDSARLDSLLLLEDVTGKNRTQLLAYPDIEPTTEQQNALDAMILRRLEHEPLAYIRGKSEFYGRTFPVDQRVLVPRPESEDILDLLSEYNHVPTIIDVGTGSGALAVSASLMCNNSVVYGLDVDPECLALAQVNASNHQAAVTFLQSDLLRAMTEHAFTTPFAVLANLPYVPTGYAVNAAAMHEPKLALYGGKDGLDLYRVMFDQLREYEDEEIIVLTESLESQHTSLAGIAHDAGFVVARSKGLIQAFTHLPV